MTDGWTDNVTETTSTLKFPAPAVRFIRSPFVRSLIRKKLLCQVTQESSSAPFRSVPSVKWMWRSNGAGSHHATRPELRVVTKYIAVAVGR